MPYLKFNEEDLQKIEDLVFDISKANANQVKGLVAFIKDPKYGFVVFLTKKPYMEELKKTNLYYAILPREIITAPYAIALRKFHTEYSNEL